MTDKLLGITVFPEYIQSEGIERILDNLAACHANAVTISPYVMAEADEQTGNREPPADAGAGSVRLLDRPLWGKRELFVRTSPSFVPDKKLYARLRYQPAEPNELTMSEGHIVADFIAAAHARGLKVLFQIQAAIPPGYRVQFGGPVEDDQPRLPNGELPGRRVANNGSLASPEILAYEKALIRDLFRVYPEIDGIRLDWPEYPPYLLNSVFLDFCDHAKQAAEERGYNFDRMRSEVGRLYDMLHGGLTDESLRQCLKDHSGPLAEAASSAGVSDWLRFKADLSVDFVKAVRQTIDEAVGPDKELIAHAFPPPFNRVSGLDYHRVGEHCSAIGVKLYTMHWLMILRFYGDQILNANPKLSDGLLTQFLIRTLELGSLPGKTSLADFRYPEPDEPHGIDAETQTGKILRSEIDAKEIPVQILVHGYGPVSDFRSRLETAWNTTSCGIWINRYAYLADEKLGLIGGLS
ncbi:MAG TPA: hypothetical protein VLA12_10825 [Planctomycetaceae bacterium]|nr:hypothetical protein [Planctomycetaceae bacterium]